MSASFRSAALLDVTSSQKPTSLSFPHVPDPNLRKGHGCIWRVLALSAALVAAGPAQADTGSAESFGESKGCTHIHRSKVAYKRIRGLVRHTAPTVDKGRVRHYATCLDTHAKAHRAHELARIYWAWRHAYSQVWQIRLNRMPAGWVQWAKNITMCESRWDRYASNGSHFSYFQFSAPTWAAASAGFDPPPSIYEANWAHQAVIAINWAWTAGVSQWTCRG